MNTLTTTGQTGTLAATSPKLDRLLSIWSNKLEPDGVCGHVIAANEAPTPEQRQWLENRKARIEDYEKPMAEKEIGNELSRLFFALGHPKADGLTAEMIAEMYFMVLRDLPGPTIRETIQAYIFGKLGNGDFAPKPPALRQAVLKRPSLAADEWFRIDRVLRARIVASVETTKSDDTKARVAKAAAEMVRGALMEKGRGVAA